MNESVVLIRQQTIMRKKKKRGLEVVSVGAPNWMAVLVPGQNK